MSGCLTKLSVGGENATRLWVRLVQVKFILLERNKHTETNVCDNGISQMKAKYFLCKI